MHVICEPVYCTGCGLCVEVCPCNAINMAYDEKGFLRPNIDWLHCIDCGKCKLSCPQNGFSAVSIERKQTPITYACMHIDKTKRIESTSGGAFKAIADYIISVKQGIVFGAHYDAQRRVVEHMCVIEINDLPMIQGSKYIQSETEHSYSAVRDALCNGKWVLFSGCPCQVSALYIYLGKDFERLVTCDVVCHGVGSTLFFQRYLSEIEENVGDTVKDYKFRDKSRGWNNRNTLIRFGNGRETNQLSRKDPYMTCYCQQAIYRDSCYACKYAKLPRCGDFTLGDYFGLPFKVFGKEGEESGISLLMVSSDKATALLSQLNRNLVLRERPLQEAIETNRNITAPSIKPPYYAALIPPTMTIKELARRYCARTCKQITKAKLKEWLIKMQLIHR